VAQGIGLEFKPQYHKKKKKERKKRKKKEKPGATDSHLNPSYLRGRDQED
jgi:hypothetical protein